MYGLTICVHVEAWFCLPKQQGDAHTVQLVTAQRRKHHAIRPAIGKMTTTLVRLVAMN